MLFSLFFDATRRRRGRRFCSADVVMGFSGERDLGMVAGEDWVGDGDRGGRGVERVLRALVPVAFPLGFGAEWDFLLRAFDCRVSC